MRATRSPRTARPSLRHASWCAALVAGATFAVAAPPVDAGSPVSQELTWVSCPEAGRSFGATRVPAPPAVVGLVVDGPTVGVATSLWLASGAGTPLVPLWSRPGVGLERRTVWCYWPWAESPTGFVGAHLLLSGAPPT